MTAPFVPSALAASLAPHPVPPAAQTYLKIPREVKEYEEALKLDDEEGDRFFLQPGGKYILKQQRTGFMYVYGGSYVSTRQFRPPPLSPDRPHRPPRPSAPSDPSG